ncbi:MAG: (2Fe-2S)-binding protein [Acidobacteriales bacterium]|nr:(2Fe-2S)-binding protein [Terriglobales bacterium]
MNTLFSPRAYSHECSARVACRCLQVSEEVVLEAVTTLGLRTVKDIRRHTGAGDGCTACHQQLCELLKQHS